MKGGYWQMGTIATLTLGSRVKSLVNKKTRLDSIQKGEIYEVQEIHKSYIVVSYDGVELEEGEFEVVESNKESDSDIGDLASRVISRVRDMYKYDSLLKKALKVKASVVLVETAEGLKIEEIKFNSQGYLVIITGAKVTITEESTHSTRTLIEYNGYQELARMV